MNVLLVNGSPHIKGCTFTALSEVAYTLQENGIGTKIMHIGNRPMPGCMGCGKCFETGRCIFDDIVNEFLDMTPHYDGFIFGSPVHYAAASGAITSFMDRAFYGRKGEMALKPAAAVLSCRRAGSTAAFDQLNKYFTINNMPVVSSQYWNMVHGTNPEEVKSDTEGLQIMRTLGRNMSWLLRCIEAGRRAGIADPEFEKWTPTNFIR